MFNTELFVLEVQKRPCLWNTKDSSHSDREQRIRAWKQIARVLNTSSDSYSVKNKYITIDELQRKWKHLRDYYTREKKRTSKPEGTTGNNNADSSSSVGKKRKSPLLDMLQFLDANKGVDIAEVTLERNAEEEHFYPENDEEEAKILSEIATARMSKIQKTDIQQSRPNEVVEDNENSSDKEFLISLLPVIRNMTAKEKSNFRSQLINPTPKECPLPCNNDNEKLRITEIRKRNKTMHTPEEMEDVNKTSNRHVAMCKRDDFAIFGEYVANKLRNIQNKHARHTAEFHINGVLYKAEMGEYDIVSRDITNTKPTSSREYSNARVESSLICDEDDSNDTTDIKAEVLD